MLYTITKNATVKTYPTTSAESHK